MSGPWKYVSKARPPPENVAQHAETIMIESGIFDCEEIYPNCTVQVLKNSVTGEVSVGWWENEEYNE